MHGRGTCRACQERSSDSLTYKIIMSEVLTEFPAAVRISGTACAAARAPKIALKWALGLDGAPHPGCSDSGRIRAGRTGRNPRRSQRDSCTHRERASRRARNRSGYVFLRPVQKAAVPGVGSVRTATCQLSVCELQQNGDKGARPRESAGFQTWVRETHLALVAQPRIWLSQSRLSAVQCG